MTPSRFLRSAVLWLPLVAISAFCALRAFPVYDDGYLVLLMREAGVDGIAAAHPDRPLYGLLLELCARIGGGSPAFYVAVSLALWLALAVEASVLWALLLPAIPDMGAVVGTLCLAPVFVQTQLTTVTLALTAGLAVDLALAGFLLVLGDGAEEWPLVRGAAACALTVAGALVSEYGVFTSLAGAALLLVLRRPRPAAFVATLAGIGYGIFRATGHLNVRPEVTPEASGIGVLRHPLQALLRELLGAWTATGGAIDLGLGSIRIEAGSRSTLLAAALGAGMALIVYRSGRSPGERSDAEPETRKLVALFAAIAVGVLPGVLLARPVDEAGFPSRFRMPALAFGAVFVTALLSMAVIPRWRSAAICVLAFLAGYRTVVAGADALRTRETLAELGGRLRPLVEQTQGLVVLVTSEQIGGQGVFPMVAKSTLEWPRSLARRVWLVSPTTAREIAGVGAGCRPSASVTLSRGLRLPPLRGPLGALLSVEVRDGQPGEIVPYCGTMGGRP